MKNDKSKTAAFHGFASNPEKSFEAGKKGSRLAVEATLKSMNNTGPNTQSKPAPSADELNNHQGRSAKGGKGWVTEGKNADNAGGKSASSEA